MRLFEKFPKEATCPVCGTNYDKPCYLISIQGTQEGNLCEAAPVHQDCLDTTAMMYNREVGVIYIKADRENFRGRRP